MCDIETLQRRGVKVAGDEVEVHLVVDYGATIPAVAADGAAAGHRLSARMADVAPTR